MTDPMFATRDAVDAVIEAVDRKTCSDRGCAVIELVRAYEAYRSELTDEAALNPPTRHDPVTGAGLVTSGRLDELWQKVEDARWALVRARVP